MSHPFCNTEAVCQGWPLQGWASWNQKAIYVRTTIDGSVQHPQACAEAITRWNQAVGARFLLVPDAGPSPAGEASVTFYERNSNEYPFSTWPLAGGTPAAGFCLNFDSAGQMLGTTPGKVKRTEIYLNRDVVGRYGLEVVRYREAVNVYAHELGHAFGLADHPLEDINSVMSYQPDGRCLLGPSKEDVDGIAHIYGLTTLDVSPSMLEGADKIETIWHYDRYRNVSGPQPQGGRWRFWSPTVEGGQLERLEPYEVYQVSAREDVQLGFGRFHLMVPQGSAQRWVYL